MKILRRRNGGWCMEHNGHEAPYYVMAHADGTFTVYDDDDDTRENPIAYNESKDSCERRTLDHYDQVATGGGPGR